MLIADPEPPELIEKFQDFTLKVFMDALDLIEHERNDPEWVIGELRRTEGTFGLYRRREAHPLLLSWSAEAVRRYLAARAADQHARQAAGFPLTVPVRDTWVVGKDPGPVDARGADTYEMTAWGRRYAALDGSTRELWLLTFGAAKEDRPEGKRPQPRTSRQEGGQRAEGGGSGTLRSPSTNSRSTAPPCPSKSGSSNSAAETATTTSCSTGTGRRRGSISRRRDGPHYARPSTAPGPALEPAASTARR